MKLCAVHCRAATLLKHWYTINIFVKIYFLRELVFDINSERALWCSLFVADLQSVQLEICNFTNLNFIIEIILKNLQTFQINYFFVASSFVLITVRCKDRA